jgi:hypothetical protein
MRKFEGQWKMITTHFCAQFPHLKFEYINIANRGYYLMSKKQPSSQKQLKMSQETVHQSDPDPFFADESMPDESEQLKMSQETVHQSDPDPCFEEESMPDETGVDLDNYLFADLCYTPQETVHNLDLDNDLFAHVGDIT